MFTSGCLPAAIMMMKVNVYVVSFFFSICSVSSYHNCIKSGVEQQWQRQAVLGRAGFGVKLLCGCTLRASLRLALFCHQRRVFPIRYRSRSFVPVQVTCQRYAWISTMYLNKYVSNEYTISNFLKTMHTDWPCPEFLYEYHGFKQWVYVLIDIKYKYELN